MKTKVQMKVLFGQFTNCVKAMDIFKVYSILICVKAMDFFFF